MVEIPDATPRPLRIGLQFLAGLSKLKMLGLYSTAVSDEGFMHLHSLKGLRLLTVGDSQVTPKGKKTLRKANPDLKIVDYEPIY